MQFSSALLENAVNEFARLPGIGKKTALRLVLHLLKQETADVQHFGEIISKMRSEIKFCHRCANVADGDICSICANSMRKQEVICVVENIRDVIAIESTQQFNGTYHVLGGVISPLDGIGPDQLKIESLINRVQKDQVQEIIFALSPTIQGDTTIFYIQKKNTTTYNSHYHHFAGHCLWRRTRICGWNDTGPQPAKPAAGWKLCGKQSLIQHASFFAFSYLPLHPYQVDLFIVQPVSPVSKIELINAEETFYKVSYPFIFMFLFCYRQYVPGQRLFAPAPASPQYLLGTEPGSHSCAAYKYSAMNTNAAPRFNGGSCIPLFNIEY